MATVKLKNVPAELVTRLTEGARQNRRNLNQEALARLEASLAPQGRCGPAAAAALRRLHRRMAGLAPLTDAFLDRAKRE